MVVSEYHWLPGLVALTLCADMEALTPIIATLEKGRAFANPNPNWSQNQI